MINNLSLLYLLNLNTKILENDNVRIDRSFCLCFREELHFIINTYTILSIKQLHDNHYHDTNVRFIQTKRLIQKFRHFNNIKQECVSFRKLLTCDINFFNNNLHIIIINIVWYILNSTLKRSNLCHFWKSHDSLTHDKATLAINTYKRNNLNQHNENKLEINTSIHSHFLFLENRLKSYDIKIEGNQVCCLHPEIALRITRKYIKDVTLLHYFRRILYDTLNNVLKPVSVCGYIENYLKNILYNLIALQSDFFIRKELHDLKKKITEKVLDVNNIKNFKKWTIFEFNTLKCSINYSYNKCLSEIISISQYRELGVSQVPLYVGTYSRYNFSYLFLFCGQIGLSALFYMRLNRFWKRRLSMEIEENKRSTDFGIDKTELRCLNSVIRIKKNKVHITIVGSVNSLSAYIDLPIFCFFVYPYQIIKILNYYQVCNIRGYPISKLGWVSLSDTQIIGQFKQIYYNFAYYYSGIINRKTLQYLYQIIGYSCAKTLACKHKTTLRHIKDIYGIQLNVKDLSISNKSLTFNSLINNTEYGSSRRVWHLDLIHQDIFQFTLVLYDQNKLK